MPPGAGDRDAQLQHWARVDKFEARREVEAAAQESIRITRQGDYALARSQEEQIIDRPRTQLGRSIVTLVQKYL